MLTAAAQPGQVAPLADPPALRSPAAGAKQPDAPRGAEPAGSTR